MTFFTYHNISFQRLFIGFFALVLLASCSESETVQTENPLADKFLQASVLFPEHTLEVYTDHAQIEIGHTPFYFKLSQTSSKQATTDFELEWTPMMHMTRMKHSCPKTSPTPLMSLESLGIQQAYAIFQMASNESEYWELGFKLRVNGASYDSKTQILVQNPIAGHARVQSFMGSDNHRYVLAMVAPKLPKVGTNLMSAQLYKMNSMTDFTQQKDALIIIDPRMPGMGNHSSPNNVNLTFNPVSMSYEGALNLTMTGYWKINLMLENATGVLLKGEPITDENEGSSLFFELEF